MPSIDAADWGIRGTLLSSSIETGFDLSELPPGTSAIKMVYRSISGLDGKPTQVSGAVFVPPGKTPEGGWPVIGYAHGTVGITSDCGPTDDSHLFGDLKAVAIQIGLGYAVAYTDYVGLGRGATGSGNSSRHPYLEPKSAAFNVIDSVRAAQTVAPELSRRWIALGASQGGAAAWAAAEYQSAYGQGTDLVGAAVLVPTLDLAGLVTDASGGRLTVDQTYLWPYVVDGLANVDPQIRTENYLHAAMRANESKLISCKTDPSFKGQLRDQLDESTVAPSSQQAAEQLRSRLASYALPQKATAVPLLSVYGGADHTVLPQWTEVAMGRACSLGDTIFRVRIEDQGHEIDPGALLGQWMADRFSGIPATGNC